MILALDLSTKSTGYAIFDSKNKLIKSGCIVATSKDVINRIYKITELLKDVIKNIEIEKVIIEEVRPEFSSSPAKTMHTQKVLMWLQSSIIFLFHDINPSIEFIYLYPSEWRAAIGIKTGQGVKRDLLKVKDIKFVKENYNLEVNDDEADAICIGHAYVNQINNEINWE